MLTVDLVFPPLIGTNYPYLSTAVLAAFVEQESSHRVRQFDLNNRYINRLLRPATVSERVSTAHHIISDLARSHLDAGSAVEFAQCLTAISRGETVGAVLPAALQTLRSTDGIANPHDVAAADAVIQDAVRAASVGRAPERLDFSDSTFVYSGANPGELRRGIWADESSVAVDFDAIIDDDELRGDVVGLSIVYRAQVLPALTLARWVKAHRGGRVIVGGPFFTTHRSQLPRNEWLFDLVDAFVMYEGERPLVEYLDAVDAGAPLTDVRGLIWAEDGAIRHSGRPMPVPANELPTPTFEGLPLSEYLLPDPVLPLLASRGCYWDCAFCTHHYIYGNTYRVRSQDLIAKDLQELQSRYACHHVYFVDESMSPKLLRHISRSILSSGSDLRWGCETRLEKSIQAEDLRQAAAAGCRVISFGLESANQRVLDRMNKGIATPNIERILHACKEVGIHAHAMCIIGFPGETEEEARETIAFTATHKDEIDLLDFSVFCLNRGSPVDFDPASYGVRNKRPLGRDNDFEERLAYDVDEGLDPAEAYSLWSEAVASDHYAEILRRRGHRQRERFMFLADAAPSSRDGFAAKLRGYPNRVVPCHYDIDSIRRAEDLFRAASARTYHLQGVGVRTAWDIFRSTETFPRRSRPNVLVFVPARWSDVQLDAVTVQLADLVDPASGGTAAGHTHNGHAIARWVN